MSYKSQWTTSKAELKKLCDIYSHEYVAELLGYSVSYINKKRKEFGLNKKRLNNGSK